MNKNLAIGCLLSLSVASYGQAGYHILPNGRVGINNTNPLNRLTINSDASDPYGINGSGLRFGNLNSSSSAAASNGKVLSVDNNGDVILVNDQIGSGTFNGAENGCSVNTNNRVELGNGNNGTAGQLTSTRYIPQNNFPVIFSGNNTNDRIVFGSNGSPATMEGRVNIETTTGNAANANWAYGLNIYARTNAWSNAGINAIAEDYNGSTPAEQTGVRATAMGVNELRAFWGRAEGLPGSSSNIYGGDFLALSPNGQPTGVIAGVNTGAQNQGGAVSYGIKSEAGFANTNFGGRFTASNGNTNYGIWATASSGPTNWAGYFVGNVQVTGQMWNNATLIFSDQRFKRNTEQLNNTIEKIKKIKGYSYQFKTEEFKDRGFPEEEQIGFVAQQLKEVFPQLVTEGKDGYYAVNYTGLIPVLVEGIKEQQERIEKLEEQLAMQTLANGGGGATDVQKYGAEQFTMLQNEPNPFSHETTIRYNIDKNSREAYINVYDLTGKELARFAINARETSYVLSANDLAAGIYLYSVVTDGKILDTKRMVIAGK